MQRPNIVMMTTDQQRWDSLRCNGNVFASTPHLDQLAKEGTRFENSFTPWPVCTPARATMWTGVYPHRHGITYNVYDLANALRDGSREKRNLFEYLQSAGYATAYYGKWHLGDEDPGVFDVWDGFNSLGSHWVDGKRDGEYKSDVQTTRLIEFLERRAQSDQPFLAVIGYYPPHTPYTAPKRFYEHYRGRDVPFAGY